MDDLGMFSSGVVTGWGGRCSRHRWRRLWSRLSVLVRCRRTCSFASPACLRILWSAIVARKASGHVVLTKHSRVSLYRKLKQPEVTKFADCSSDTITISSQISSLSQFSMGSGTAIDSSAALLLSNVWDLIAQLKILIPTKRSYMDLIWSGYNIWKVKRMASITPSKAEFLLLRHCMFLYSAEENHLVAVGLPLQKSDIDLLWAVHEVLAVDVMNSSSARWDGDSSTVQRSAWLGWMCSWSHLSFQPD